MMPASPISVNAKAVKLQRIELVDVDNYVNRVFDTVGNATRSIMTGNTGQRQSEQIRIHEIQSTSSESSFIELRASTIHQYGVSPSTKDGEPDEESNIVERPDIEAHSNPHIVSSLKNNNLPSPQHFRKLVADLNRQFGKFGHENGTLSRFETLMTDEPVIFCQNMDASSINRLNTEYNICENEP